MLTLLVFAAAAALHKSEIVRRTHKLAEDMNNDPAALNNPAFAKRGWNLAEDIDDAVAVS